MNRIGIVYLIIIFHLVAIAIIFIVYGVVVYKYQDDSTTEYRQEYFCQLTNRVTFFPNFYLQDVYLLLSNCTGSDQSSYIEMAAFKLGCRRNDVPSSYFYSPVYDRGGILLDGKSIPILHDVQNYFNSNPTNYRFYLSLVIIGSSLALPILILTVNFFKEGFESNGLPKPIPV